MEQVRIGVLGAARIVPSALIVPAQQVPEATVVTIAARNPQRAQAFAHKYQLPNSAPTYDAVLADSTIDAVYIPLPNSFHAQWTIKALEAGKHVLCEKPFAANADEAQQVAQVAATTGKVVMEAFHYRYHPLARRMHDIIQSGELGKVRHIEIWMCIPLPVKGDIRYNYDLAGGATMDIGSYAIHMLRLLAGNDLTVTNAQARLVSPQIDRWMRAEFQCPDESTARMTCSLLSADLVHLSIRVLGEHGEMRVINPLLPHFFHRLTVQTKQGKRVEHFPRIPSYVYQLRAFTDAILHGTPVLTPPTDALANMHIIDAVYKKAGLLPRGQLHSRA